MMFEEFLHAHFQLNQDDQVESSQVWRSTWCLCFCWNATLDISRTLKASSLLGLKLAFRQLILFFSILFFSFQIAWPLQFPHLGWGQFCLITIYLRPAVPFVSRNEIHYKECRGDFFGIWNPDSKKSQSEVSYPYSNIICIKL